MFANICSVFVIPLDSSLNWVVKPLSPNINMHDLLSVFQIFLMAMGTSWENCIKHPDILSW